MATRRLYRAKKGEFLGVCQGIAEWRDLPVGAVRLMVILIAMFTAIFPTLLVYCIVGFLLPVNPYNEDGGKTYYYKPEPEDFVKTESKTYTSEEEERRKRENDWDNRFSKS